MSAHAYCDVTGRRLRLLWVPNQQCGARFEDLFTNEVDQCSLLGARLLARTSGGWLEHLEELDFDLRPWERRRCIALQSSQPFGHVVGVEWEKYLRHLSPTPELRERMTATWSILDTGAPVVGLMIRAHPSAHDVTAESRPLDYAVQRMRAIQSDVPDVRWFLSTDSEAVRETIHGEFSDVIELEGKGEFNSVRGVQDALCDMYLLASTSWMIGSHYSSLSELAILLRGCERFETSHTGPGSQIYPAMTEVESLWSLL